MIKSANKLIMSILMILGSGIFFASPVQANVLRDIQDVGVAVGIIPLGCATSDIIWAARCHASNAQYRLRDRRQRQEGQEAERNQRQVNNRPEIVQSNPVRQRPIDPRIIAMVRDLESKCNAGNQAACRQLGAR